MLFLVLKCAALTKKLDFQQTLHWCYKSLLKAKIELSKLFGERLILKKTKWESSWLGHLGKDNIMQITGASFEMDEK